MPAGLRHSARPLEGEPLRYHSPLHILGKNDPDLEEGVRGLNEIWHSLEVGFKPYPVGLFNNGPVEICLDFLAESPIDVGAIDSVVVRTYHDAWKFTGQKYTTTESNYVDLRVGSDGDAKSSLSDVRLWLV